MPNLELLEGPIENVVPKILIAESEEPVAVELQTNICKAGYHVPAVVDSGEAVLETVRTVSPDLILMDISLRGPMDGIEAARRVQQFYDVPIIYMAAHSDPDTVSRAKETGPYGYFSKPLSQINLPTSIEIALYKHRMEREVRRQRAWLRTTLRSMTDGVIVTDHLGRIRFMNPAAAAISGWEVAEALKLPVSRVLNLIHPVEGPWFGKLLAGASNGEKQQFPTGLKLITKSSQQISVEGEISSSSEGETQFGNVTTFRDVTQREQDEQERRHEQKMDAVGRLAGGVAHDFNNLLTVILGHADILMNREGPALDPATRQSLRDIAEAGISAAHLTHQLLTFSRDKVVENRVVDVSSVVRENEGLSRRLLGPGVRWRTALCSKLKPVCADPRQIAQILLNLVSNAVDAMPQGGILTVSTENVESGQYDQLDANLDQHVVLSVSDTGVGMHPAVAEHVFEPFFTTKSAGQGKGLGLSIVYNIVDQLGGVISVESKPGAGSTFRVFIPFTEQIAGPVAVGESRRRPATNAQKAILLVDDNAAVRALIAKFLQDAGYKVLTANDGAHALTIAAETDIQIHALVTDVVMPRVNGVHLAETLIQRQPNLKVVFVSGYAGDILDNRNAQLAGARFLQKPFLHTDLIQLVKEVLGDLPPGTSPHLPLT